MRKDASVDGSSRIIESSAEKSYQSISTEIPDVAVITSEKLTSSTELNKSVQTEVKDDKIKPESTPLWTGRVLLIMPFLVSLSLLQGACYSLLAPFYPIEATNKDNSATQFGFVYGFYEIVVLCTAPIYGKLLSLNKISPKTLTCIGVLIDATCCIIFGTVAWVPAGNAFFGVSMLVRCLQATGASAALTCFYTVVGTEFPEHVGKLMPIVETSFGVGLMIGPSIGGVLYDEGGFSLPFFVMGSISLIGGLACAIFFPKIIVNDEPSTIGLKDVLMDWRIVMDMLLIATSFATLGFNEATLALHLEQFELPYKTSGLIFVVSGGTHSFMSVIWGQLSDRTKDARSYCMIGCILITIAFIFVGPAPFIPINTQLWIVIVCQVLIGAGVGAKFICAFMHALKYATDVKGFPNSMATYALMSSIFSAFVSGGSFFGPVLAGVLLDTTGYEAATMYFAMLEIICGVLLFGAMVYDRCHIRYKSVEKLTEQHPEKKPLLAPLQRTARRVSYSSQTSACHA